MTNKHKILMTPAELRAPSEALQVTIERPEARRQGWWWLRVTRADGTTVLHKPFARKRDVLEAKREFVAAQARQINSEGSP